MCVCSFVCPPQNLLLCHDYPSLSSPEKNVNGTTLPVSQLEQGGAWRHRSSSNTYFIIRSYRIFLLLSYGSLNCRVSARYCKSRFYWTLMKYFFHFSSSILVIVGFIFHRLQKLLKLKAKIKMRRSES